MQKYNKQYIRLGKSKLYFTLDIFHKQYCYKHENSNLCIDCILDEHGKQMIEI